MAADKRDAESWQESEFGVGTGAIDPVRRADRNLSAAEFEMEIMALPKTFGGSALGLPGGERPTVEETPVPRLLPGEVETDRA